jgi:calcium/calmodulin-dependent protein kinase I
VTLRRVACLGGPQAATAIELPLRNTCACALTLVPLQLENLLLADKNDLRSVRISDFGLAKATFGSPDGENPFAMEVMCGTLAYVAPEVLARRPYGPAVDMWSCGVILFILLSGVVPFSDPDERRLMARIMAAKYSMAGPEWVSVSNDAKSLVQGLMCISPAARFTATQALQHPWLLLHDATGASQKPLRVASGRLAEYAARAKPPVRRFAPGDFLIRRGQRATAVYLIREGFVELLVDEPDASRPASDGGEAQEQPAEQRYTTLDRRGPGDFVGEQGVITDARGDLMLSSSLRVARPSLAPMPGEGDSTASTERGPQMPPSGRPPRPPESGGIQRGEGEKRWSSPLSAHKFAKKWVGNRRSSSVRAVTDVIAVALRRADMEWVLTESPATAEEEDAASMRQELQHALRRSASSASKGRSTIGAGVDC